MRMLLIAGLALSMISTGALAESYKTPKALLNALYAPILAGAQDWDERSFFSTALNGLYEADEAQTEPGDSGTIDFDPVIAGQDWDLKSVDIGTPKIDDDTAEVQVDFVSFDTPVTLTYYLVNEDGGWLIDDIESLTNEYPWRLTTLFEDAGITGDE